jgi:hypothetical protein
MSKYQKLQTKVSYADNPADGAEGPLEEGRTRGDGRDSKPHFNSENRLKGTYLGLGLLFAAAFITLLILAIYYRTKSFTVTLTDDFIYNGGIAHVLHDYNANFLAVALLGVGALAYLLSRVSPIWKMIRSSVYDEYVNGYRTLLMSVMEALSVWIVAQMVGITNWVFLLSLVINAVAAELLAHWMEIENFAYIAVYHELKATNQKPSKDANFLPLVACAFVYSGYWFALTFFFVMRAINMTTDWSIYIIFFGYAGFSLLRKTALTFRYLNDKWGIAKFLRSGSRYEIIHAVFAAASHMTIGLFLVLRTVAAA